MLRLHKNPQISGFTTNPTLMHRAGVTDYRAFAKDILQQINDCPVSFEVFADDFDEMARQAREVASWGSNVYVKIPITDIRGVSSVPLIRQLVAEGLQLNVTAILSLSQLYDVIPVLTGGPPAFVSIFAGRIADTGRDPYMLMRDAVRIVRQHLNIELIWASTRELLNVVQANHLGCHVITVTSQILAKLSLLDRDLDQLSLETVQMFSNDAKASGYSL